MILKFGAVVEDVRVDAWTSLSFLTVFFFVCVRAVNKRHLPDTRHLISQVEIYLPERRHTPVANGVETEFCLVDYKSVTYSLNFVYIHEFKAV